MSRRCSYPRASATRELTTTPPKTLIEGRVKDERAWKLSLLCQRGLNLLQPRLLASLAARVQTLKPCRPRGIFAGTVIRTRSQGRRTASSSTKISTSRGTLGERRFFSLFPYFNLYLYKDDGSRKQVSLTARRVSWYVCQDVFCATLGSVVLPGWGAEWGLG